MDARTTIFKPAPDGTPEMALGAEDATPEPALCGVHATASARDVV